MKVTNARERPMPKLCDQCGAKLSPPRPDGAILCPNAAACGYPPYWGAMSQAVAAAVIRVRARDGRIGVLVVQHNGSKEWEISAGFNPLGESSDECAARETDEEGTVQLDPEKFWHVDFETVPEGHLVAFHLYKEIVDEDDLPPFAPNNEKQARKICFDPEELHRSTHRQVARDTLGGRFDNYRARIPAPS